MHEKYEELLTRYTREGLPEQDELVELFQYLLDTDKINEMSPRMQQYSNYLLMEGFLYNVHTGENEES